MVKNVKRKFLILVALILANVVGYFAATTYFNSANKASTTSTKSIGDFQATKMLSGQSLKLIEKGMEIIRQIHF